MMVIWVALGGRGKLWGAIFGALLVNYMQSSLMTSDLPGALAVRRGRHVPRRRPALPRRVRRHLGQARSSSVQAAATAGCPWRGGIALVAAGACFVLAEALGLMPALLRRSRSSRIGHGRHGCSVKYLLLVAVLLAAAAVYHGGDDARGQRRATAAPSRRRGTPASRLRECRRMTAELAARVAVGHEPVDAAHRVPRRTSSSPSTGSRRWTSTAFGVEPQRAARGHRPQRRGQDHALRRHQRQDPRRSGQGLLRRRRRSPTRRDVEIARLGVGRKFQTPTVFDSLTVYENMELALPGRRSVCRTSSASDTPQQRDAIFAILDRVHLIDDARHAGQVPQPRPAAVAGDQHADRRRPQAAARRRAGRGPDRQGDGADGRAAAGAEGPAHDHRHRARHGFRPPAQLAASRC